MKKLFLSFLLFCIAGIEYAQNVGIGTTTPAAKLDVKTSSSYVAQFNGAAPMYMGIFENDIYRGYWGSYSGNPEDVDFGTGSGNSTGKLHLTIQASPKLTINNNGFVGIGITNPTHLLHVNGGDLFVQSSSGAIRFGYESGNQWQLATTGGGADLRWSTTVDGGTTTIPRHYFSQNGNVGLGGFNDGPFVGLLPKARLDVFGSGNTAATNTLLIRNSVSDSIFKVRDDGEVFVGNPIATDIFNYRFRVESGNRGSLFIENPIVSANSTVKILRGVPESVGTYTSALYVEAGGDVGAYFKGLGGIDATATNSLYPAGNFTSAVSGYAITAHGKLLFNNIGEGNGKVLTSDATGNATWATLTGTHNHFGETWTGNANWGLAVQNSTTNSYRAGLLGDATGDALVFGVEGHVSSVHATGVLGLNDVGGTYAGIIENVGVQGVANSGVGVFGASVSGVSVYGLKLSTGTNSVARFENQNTSNTSPVVQIASNATNPTALELNNGYLKVSGTNKMAFIVTATAGNSSAHILNLSYPNQASTDILLVTHNYTPTSNYLNAPYSVYWNGSNWAIYLDNFSAILSQSFNVMVIKQ